MSWWNSNAGQNYQNEIARQKKRKSMDQSKLDAAEKKAKTEKEKRRIKKIKAHRNARNQEQRRKQKAVEGQQKGWWW